MVLYLTSSPQWQRTCLDTWGDGIGEAFPELSTAGVQPCFRKLLSLALSPPPLEHGGLLQNLTSEPEPNFYAIVFVYNLLRLNKTKPNNNKKIPLKFLETVWKGFGMLLVCSKGCTFSFIVLTEKEGWIQFSGRNSHFSEDICILGILAIKESSLADCPMLLCEGNFDHGSWALTSLV